MRASAGAITPIRPKAVAYPRGATQTIGAALADRHDSAPRTRLNTTCAAASAKPYTSPRKRPSTRIWPGDALGDVGSAVFMVPPAPSPEEMSTPSHRTIDGTPIAMPRGVGTFCTFPAARRDPNDYEGAVTVPAFPCH